MQLSDWKLNHFNPPKIDISNKYSYLKDDQKLNKQKEDNMIKRRTFNRRRRRRRSECAEGCIGFLKLLSIDFHLLDSY